MVPCRYLLAIDPGELGARRILDDRSPGTAARTVVAGHLRHPGAIGLPHHAGDLHPPATCDVAILAGDETIAGRSDARLTWVERRQ